jgi:uncharacterized protein (TIGR03118 family)
VLEDRKVLSGYQQTNLVGYEPGLAHFTDSSLNGWGMTSMPDGSFAVANAFTSGKVTFYDRSGHELPQTITVPSSSVPTMFGLPGSAGHPTGVVLNPTKDGFQITNPQTGKSAPAILIFDTIDGTISGWNPAVNATQAIVIKDTWAAGAPAIYTGLEVSQNSEGHTVLYAADLFNDDVQMFDTGFNPIGVPMTDPSVPSLFTDPNGLNAWSVQAVNGELYVTFANPLSAIKGPHGGVVDVFNTDGRLLKRFAANAPGAGPLENPWGIIQAPANFGEYSNDLLIGNVAGDGNINVYDPTTDAYLGKMDHPDGTPISIPGLWDLEFGDGTPDSGKTNQLFFDAGPNAPGITINGLFGVIRAAGDQGGDEDGDHMSAVAAPSQPVQPMLLGQMPNAGVRAAAPSAYLANSTLDSTQTAAQNGFTVLGNGVVTATINVGSNGDAFGVSNNSTATLLDLLPATNEQAMGGWHYVGVASRRSHANSV